MIEIFIILLSPRFLECNLNSGDAGLSTPSPPKRHACHAGYTTEGGQNVNQIKMLQLTAKIINFTNNSGESLSAYGQTNSTQHDF